MSPSIPSGNSSLQRLRIFRRYIAIMFIFDPTTTEERFHPNVGERQQSFTIFCCFGMCFFFAVVIRDDPYWTSRKNSLELIELSSINKVSLV